MANSFCSGGVGLQARLRLAVEDLRDDVFNPPTPRTSRSPMCTHHPTFVTCSAAGLHAAPVRGGEVVLLQGPHEVELAKDGRTDGDALGYWAIGGTLPL